MKNLLYLLSFALLVLTGCRGSSDDSIPATPGETTVATGKVSGKVVAKNGVKPIGGALIFTFDENSKIYSTYSDENGDFTLVAPEGQRTVQIQTGNGTNFRTEVAVNVKKDETVNLTSTQSVLNQVAKMAFVHGNYDKIEDIVTSLGYTITPISYNDLKMMNIVAQYDIIFLNCGSRNSTSGLDQIIDTNLSNFVSNGGSLYASDWDIAYLIGGNMNTNACGSVGGFINDNLLCSVNNGSATTLANCTVSNPALATALGFGTLDIHYDLGAWQKIQTYDPTFWEVLVKQNNEALMLRTNMMIRMRRQFLAETMRAIIT